ncbi:hypothetical protein DF3PB_2180005 [uncultured Defluviicoccus sp.]|uniref:Uncharacterized protein n=1 Tax=metagenome TaxID=256318 RepID=A0A380TDX4_9ZZZZ|nr:hypothetical protein DF3PB_2180005 [uncultured Defluviicoccus sp.]
MLRVLLLRLGTMSADPASTPGRKWWPLTLLSYFFNSLLVIQDLNRKAAVEAVPPERLPGLPAHHAQFDKNADLERTRHRDRAACPG